MMLKNPIEMYFVRLFNFLKKLNYEHYQGRKILLTQEKKN
jgi:hypothetical protein